MVSSEWRDQIAGIIAETERNLGIKVGRQPPRSAKRPPPAELFAQYPPQGYSAAFAPRMAYAEPPIAAAPPADGAPPDPPSAAAAQPDEAAATAAAAQQAAIAATAAVDRNAHNRLLESVKFELEVRSSLAQKQLEAVREEMHAGSQETERKWVEMAKQMELSVAAQLESERTIRGHTEAQLSNLYHSSGIAHEETLRTIGEFQQTAIDHSEVLHRLDKELTTFRLQTETRLVEDARKLEEALQVVERGGGGGGGATPAGRAAAAGAPAVDAAHEARLAECEAALLQERDFRRTLDLQVSELRDGGGTITNAVETAVALALERSGMNQASAVLDEKVKECGRLIVRMGTELMEETKRRQALEAEVQELRMRLSGVEAVARSPLGVGGMPAGGMAGIGPAELAAGFYAGGGGTAESLMTSGVAAASFDPQGFEYAAQAAGAAAGGFAAATAPASVIRTPLSEGEAAADEGAAGVASTWNASCQAAVDAKLRELVPSIPRPTAEPFERVEVDAAAAATPRAADERLPPAVPSRGGAAAALRLSRQELDARVQQILGRHGQSLADYAPAAPPQ